MKRLLTIALFLSVSMNAYAVDNGAVGGATGVAVGSHDSAPAGKPAPVQTLSFRNVESGDERQRHDNGLHRGEHKKKHEQREGG